MPIAVSPGRAGFGPQLTLQYSTGNGNGPFGLGWQLSVPRVSRKTEKGVPRYGDDDVFILSGAEDLVPIPDPVSKRPVVTQRGTFSVTRFRPRTEGLFARIERWTDQASARAGEVHWRVTTKDNVTSLYGRTRNARITDPGRGANARRVFEWLLEETFDGKGNHIFYEYLADDTDGVSTGRAHTQRYLRRILYGNMPDSVPLDSDKRVGPKREGADHADSLKRRERHYLFEVLFDYGDVTTEPKRSDLPADPERTMGSGCPPREDPHFSCRAGFEISTRFLCRRVLMLHHFNEEGLEDAPLVKATEFEFTNDPFTKLSLLKSVRVVGYRKSTEGGTGYRSAWFPPVTFVYSAFTPAGQRYQTLDATGTERPPHSLRDPRTALVGLFGDGLPGILDSTPGAPTYWRNRGDGEFVRAPLPTFPAGIALGDPGVVLGDLAGDGLPDLIVHRDSTRGFYEATGTGEWGPFRPFRSAPTFDLSDPNVRLIDLTGDGRPDVLKTDDRYFVIFPCLGEEGYGGPVFVPRIRDLNKFPDVNLSDPRIRIADMNGDGLPDIVLVNSSGMMQYWPSLGHGQFGPCVTMKNAPRFGPNFDPKRCFLADLDGSGCADMIYVGRDSIDFWFNHSGSSWGTRNTIAGTPRVDDATSVQFTDLLGSGTASLVWSYDAGAAHNSRFRMLDFCGGKKPFLLTEMSNNLGATTRVQYGSSSAHAIQDRKQGRAWLTSLPFPVNVVDTVEVIDHISRTKLVTTYKYHHGYYSGRDREFRGFAGVEQFDTQHFEMFTKPGQHAADVAFDNNEEWMHVAPVRTVTWFHTGIYYDGYPVEGRSRPFDHHGLTAGLRKEFYQLDPLASELDAHLVESDATPHEAFRALRGSLLRSEVYAEDGSSKARHPYTVSESRYYAKLIQASAGAATPPVYLPVALESLKYHYERVPTDPRTLHTITLEVDGFGNVLKSAAIAYGRRQPDPALPLAADRERQQRALLTYSESAFTKAVDTPSAYHTPLACEIRTYELTGFVPVSAEARFRETDFVKPAAGGPERLVSVCDNEIAYETQPAFGVQRRLIEHTRTRYRKDDLSALLELGALEPLALPGESYRLAFTPGLLTKVYKRKREQGPEEDLLPKPVDVLQGPGRSNGGYVDLDGNGNSWSPSGRVFYSRSANDAPANELAEARSRFFLPMRYRDPFQTDTLVTYDAYSLLALETCDALENRVTVGERDIEPTKPLIRAGLDYRVLQPAFVMDPNRNQSAVAFDALGMVVGTAVMGKPEQKPIPGDRLGATFRSDLTEAEIQELLKNPKGPSAAALLADATTRIVYDVTAYWREPNPVTKPPAVVATIARETHVSDLKSSEKSKLQVSLSYSDGFGREIQKKIQAEPGPTPKRDANGKIIVGADGKPVMTPNEVSPRWVGSGWTVFNNKGKPVRQYEPFFTDRHRFEFDVKIGVSPVLFYDPVERVVATLHPNHTWEKVAFDPWRQGSWDVNDTVLIADPKADVDAGGFFNHLPNTDYLPTWHTLRTDAAHATAFAARYPDAADRTNETRAAEKTRVHAATPTVAHADSLGRTFLTVAHNKAKYSDSSAAAPPVEEFHSTRIVLDIEGNQREVIDAKDRVVMRYDYDMLGNRVHQASMEAGERWMLNDVAGKPLQAWDSRDHRLRTAYDPLRRPTDSFLRESTGAELLVGRSIYGESRPNPEASNLRGKVVELRDQAGVITSDKYDFKGNLLESRRRLAQEYKTTLDWSAAVPLEPECYTSRTRYDALNRPTQLIAPHSDRAGTTVNVIQPGYNEANLLEQVNAWLNLNAEPGDLFDPASANFHAVTDIDYDAKGQRLLIDYGNWVRATYTYDPQTFRLTRLLTRRNAAAFPTDCPEPPPAGWPGCQVQNLHYSYDPAGNITHIRDDAQQTIYLKNTRVEPSAEYTYDAIYRLIEATGREHLGQVGGTPIPHPYNDALRVGLMHPNDGNAVGRYLECYVYDAVGNFLSMRHRGSDPVHPGWTRTYDYSETSQLGPSKVSNRLSSTAVGATTETYSANGDGYDAHGNMLRMPHLQVMQWDFKDQLQMTQQQAVNAVDADGAQHNGERTWYVYDSAGQRVRKITVLAAGQVKDERIYLGGFEVYRRNGGNPLARETLHIMDDKRRIALVETRTQGNDPVPPQLIRYQVGNHLGSASVELDEQARLVSYEEYTPYGSTTYEAVRSLTETPKRYRYSEKERDEESGLYYYGRRYHASWLGRWCSCDPILFVDGTCLYCFAKGNPASSRDPLGLATIDDLGQVRAAGKVRESLWEMHFTSRPDVTKVVRQTSYKNPGDLKTAKLSGQEGVKPSARYPDLGVEFQGRSGQPVEVSTHRQFESGAKNMQLAKDEQAATGRLLMGNQKQGFITTTEKTFQAKDFPVLDDGPTIDIRTGLPGPRGNTPPLRGESRPNSKGLSSSAFSGSAAESLGASPSPAASVADAPSPNSVRTAASAGAADRPTARAGTAGALLFLVQLLMEAVGHEVQREVTRQEMLDTYEAQNRFMTQPGHAESISRGSPSTDDCHQVSLSTLPIIRCR